MRRALLLSLMTLLTCTAAAQTARDAAVRYSKEGLSFDYPAGWTVEEKGDADVQRVVVRRAGGSAFMEVTSLRVPTAKPEQLGAAREKLWESAFEEIRQRLGLKSFPPQAYHCPPFGVRPGSGLSLSGRSEGRGAKGEVYGMYDGSRYLTVSFFRTNGEEREASAAWKMLLETLKAEGPEGDGKERVLGAVVDGKAVSKPKPDYPEDLRAAGVGGEVVVKVTIDEKGNVIKAHADSGEPLLRASAEAAAMRAKFSPTTICDRPVKVSGVIKYNFKP